jgi:hypothetical protein
MDARLTDNDKLDDGKAERGYEAWKREKIERGIAQSRDRASMIPVEQVWRDLKLER